MKRCYIVLLIAFAFYTANAQTFSPAASDISMGNILVGSAKDDSVLIANTGVDTLFISSAISENNLFSIVTFPDTIAGGDSSIFKVIFSPIATGLQNGTIVFLHNASSSPDTVFVSGTGIAPSFLFSIFALNFGSLLFNTTSQETVFVKNSGTAPLYVTNAIAGNSEFSVAPSVATINENDSAFFIVTFSPISSGMKTANIIFTHDAESSPDTLLASGNAFDYSSISGLVFNDVNANSIKDIGENSLSNWEIILGGDIADTMMSDINGNFVFDSLLSGNYTLHQELQNNWTKTLPIENSYSFSLGIEVDTIGLNFGNVNYGSISGMKFKDVNGNGNKDAEDIGLSEWQIILEKDSIAIDTAVTDEDGNYSFTNLIDGNYEVRELQQNGWTQTLPILSAHILSLSGGTDTANINFGNFQRGAISGIVFNDKNNDSTKTLSETGLLEWLVRLQNNDVVIDSQLTDEDGNFAFTNLLVGNYSLRVEPQNGWLQTLPDSSYEITIESGSNFPAQHFGFFLPNTITLRNYTDTDALFATSNDRTGKQWHLQLYSNAVTDSTLVAESSSDTLLTVENLTDGNYIAIESDSSTYNHIGIVASDSSFATATAQITLSVANGMTKNVSFINALKRDEIIIEHYLDTDSNYTTTNDRSLKRWYLALYNGSNQLVSGADTTQLSVENLSPGTYYAMQVDSLRWKHLGYLHLMNDDTVFNDESALRKIEINLSGG